MSLEHDIHACNQRGIMKNGFQDRCSWSQHCHTPQLVVLTALRHNCAIRCAVSGGHGTPISVSPDGSSDASVWLIAAEESNALVRTATAETGWLHQEGPLPDVHDLASRGFVLALRLTIPQVGVCGTVSMG